MRIFLYIVFLILLSSCSSIPEGQQFDFFLSEPCMITNLEQNNLIEGTQLRVLSVDEMKPSITLELPENFAINSNNCTKWTVGWGTGLPYFDAGVENIIGIRGINLKTGEITLEENLLRKEFPRVGQRIVFWNSEPSDYKKVRNEPVIHPDFWPKFNGQSIAFSSIVFDEKRKLWITLVHEVDSDTIQIYAAISSDLIHWKAGNDGKPILTTDDFEKCPWGSRSGSNKSFKTPMVSEIIQKSGKYFVFMDGEDASGNRHIGLATASDLLGEYSIYERAILSPQSTGKWNDQSIFCAKVVKRKNDYVLFFDGRNDDMYEQVGRATSTDLKSWKMDSDPVLDQHEGWRSAEFTTEPNYVEARGDTVLLMVSGAKQFQENFWHQHFTHRNYLDRSGNVNDAQLGAFISTDGGKTFNPHPNNPIFTNAYIDPYENEHIGGNFERIQTDSTSYIFYQAKSSSGGLKYSIFLRSKPK